LILALRVRVEGMLIAMQVLQSTWVQARAWELVLV
jgi:hypothetical protein